MKELYRKISYFYDSIWFLWGIICFGIILRFTQYLFNRSLWLDEISLVMNIINRSFSELLQPLDSTQGAPIGFLMVEKLIVKIFGNSEYALRLFPFLCGVISLFLFYRVAKHYIARKAVPIALGLFAISNSMIYYSSEAKQYSSDVTVMLLLYVVTIYTQSEKLTTLRIVLFGVIGAIAIWFSHPAVFILAGVGMGLTLFYLGKKEWSRIGYLFIIYSIWILSFAIFYFVSLRNLSHNKVLLDFWNAGFIPFPPTTFFDVKQLINISLEIFRYPTGLSLPHISALMFFIGCVSMFLEKKKDFFVLIFPIPFVLLASGLHKYPFQGRLMLFIVPIALLFIAEGIVQIRLKTSRNSTIIGITIAGLLIFNPLLSASYHLIKPHTNEEIKPVISYVSKHLRDGDILYVYYGAQPAFTYYLNNLGFKKSDYIKGISSRRNHSKYREDLVKLRGNKRIWILFSHVCTWEGVDEERLFLYYLDSMGKRTDSFVASGASVYLYDLNK